MTSYVRVGPAPAGSTPFVKLPSGAVRFDSQNSRQIEDGHFFDSARGYRVYFKFADHDARNTWSAESLLSWANNIEPLDADTAKLRDRCRVLAHQVTRLNEEWRRRGRPAEGINDAGAGHA